MNLKNVHRMVKKVQVGLFNHANAFSQGMFKSHFKGSGVQFKEHQVYQYGDEIRFIDWNLLAKKNAPYVKTFEEERNVHIIIFIDLSPSMALGSKECSKFSVSLEILFFITMMAGKFNDTVDVIFLSGKLKSLANVSGESGVAKILAFLEREKLVTDSGEKNYQKEIKRQL